MGEQYRTNLPAWMLPRQEPLPEPSQRGRRLRRSPARRALNSLTLFLEYLVAEPQESSAGALARIDPRTKIAAAILLLVTLSLLHSLQAIAVSLAIVVLASILFRVPVRRLGGLLVAPAAFTIAISALSTLNVVTDGAPLVVLYNFKSDHFGAWALPSELSITDAGVYVAARLVLRVLACVAVVGAVALTTSRHRLLASLQAIGVPQAFGAILMMMQRYLEVMMRAAQEIHLAKLSRSVRQTGLRQEQDWVAAGIGSLLRRSRQLGEAVHLAMLSRGFDGSIRTLDSPHLKLRDIAVVAAAAAFAAGMIVLDRVQ